MLGEFARIFACLLLRKDRHVQQFAMIFIGLDVGAWQSADVMSAKRGDQARDDCSKLGAFLTDMCPSTSNFCWHNCFQGRSKYCAIRR